MTDHNVYLEENFEVFSEMPGFPYLRLNHMLFNDEMSSNMLSNANEQLLLLMHCKSAGLLAISNKRILLYNIPPAKSTTRNVLGGVGRVGLSFVPGVGELLNGASTMKSFARGTGDVIKWGLPSARRKAAQRAKERLPSIKEVRDLVWDIGDPEILAMILCYRENIILKNGFGWKVKFEKLFNNSAKILVDENGISLNIDNKKKFIKYTESEWKFVEIARLLVERNRERLEMAGWAVDVSEKIILKKG